MARAKAYRPLIVAAEAATEAVLDLKADFTSMTLQLASTVANSARSWSFYGSVNGVDYDLVAGVLLNDLTTIANATTATDQQWAFPVGDLARFKLVLNSLTGGNVSAYVSMTAGG